MLTIKDGTLLIHLLLFSAIAIVQLQGAKFVKAKNSTKMESKTDEHRPRLLGGWEDRDPEDEDIQQLLPSVLMKVNEQSNDEYHLMPIKLLNVSSQVVAGVRYKMEVRVARSQCRKSSNMKIDLTKCKKLEGHPEKVLTLDVWEKPWENFLRVEILGTKEVVL